MLEIIQLFASGILLVKIWIQLYHNFNKDGFKSDFDMIAFRFCFQSDFFH